MNIVQWGEKETVTAIKLETGERITFSYRTCSLCRHSITVDGSPEDALRLAKHVEDHETGVHEEQERALVERMFAFNRAEFERAARKAGGR